MPLTVTLKLDATNCLCPPDSYVEILIPYVIIFEQEVFGRSLGHEVRVLKNGNSALIRTDTRQLASLLSTEWAYNDKMPIQKSGSRISPDSLSTSTLNLDFPAFSLRNKCLLSHHAMEHLLSSSKLTKVLSPENTLVSQSVSLVTQWCLTLCDPMNHSTPGPLFITNFQSLLKLMSFESVIPCNHLILCHYLLLAPSIFLSIRVLSNESAFHIRWPKYWSFSFNISPSNEHPGLIFQMDWLEVTAFQGTLKSLRQHHSSRASILCSAFCIVQLSHSYMTTGKNHSLDETDLCWQSNVSAF